MATHKSAIKRNKQIIKRTVINRANRSAAKTAATKALAAIVADAKTAAASVQAAIAVWATTARKGSVPKRRAARKASRMQKALNKALTGTAATK
jgi:small subunit ribosomal protein S20